MPAVISVKYEAIRLISRLPDNVSWDDILYELFVMKQIELGVQASYEENTIPHNEIIKWLLNNVSD